MSGTKIEYVELPNLGASRFTHRGEKFKVAGISDKQSNKIAVSTDFDPFVVRFTAAHEIGHYIIHKNEVMHRDRPMDGSGLNREQRPLQEQEADYFAACFLMPRDLVTHHFREKFQTDIPFTFDELNSFEISPTNHQELVYADENSLAREMALARCRSFRGVHFDSLAKQFRVSTKAMAIRIQQLNLVRWP